MPFSIMACKISGESVEGPSVQIIFVFLIRQHLRLAVIGLHTIRNGLFYTFCAQKAIGFLIGCGG